MGKRRGEVIHICWETPIHGANVHWEFAASPAGDVGAYPLLCSGAARSGVPADVDRRSEGCESRDKEEGELHCEASNAGGRT